MHGSHVSQAHIVQAQVSIGEHVCLSQRGELASLEDATGGDRVHAYMHACIHPSIHKREASTRTKPIHPSRHHISQDAFPPHGEHLPKLALISGRAVGPLGRACGRPPRQYQTWTRSGPVARPQRCDPATKSSSSCPPCSPPQAQHEQRVTVSYDCGR